MTTEFRTNDDILTGYTDSTLFHSPDVVIPDGIAKILNGVFKNSNYQQFKFPKSLEAIYFEAFSGCRKIRELDLADTALREIAPSAFKNCKKLRKVRLPYSLETIADNSFSGCPIESVTIVNGEHSKEFRREPDDLNLPFSSYYWNRIKGEFRDAFFPKEKPAVSDVSFSDLFDFSNFFDEKSNTGKTEKPSVKAENTQAASDVRKETTQESETENRKLKQHITDPEKRLEEKERENRDNIAKSDVMTRACDNQILENKGLRQRIADLEKQLTEKERENRELNQQIDGLKNELAEKERSRKTLEENNAIRSRLLENQLMNNSQTTQLIVDLKNRLAEKDEHIKELEQLLDEQEKELLDSQNTPDELLTFYELTDDELTGQISL